MEMLLSGPLKVLGWIFVFFGVFALLKIGSDAAFSTSFITLLFGVFLILASRWISAFRGARLQYKWDQHNKRVARFQRPDDEVEG